MAGNPESKIGIAQRAPLPQFDAQLLSSGDTETWTRAFHEVNPLMLSSASWRIDPFFYNGVQTFRDAAQEAWLALWEQRKKLPAEFTSYARGIAIHKAIDIRRRTDRDRRHSLKPIDAMVNEPADDRFDTAHQAFVNADLDTVLSVLPTLPEKQRIVLVSNMLDSTAAEAAADANTTPGAARVALHRGRKRLLAAVEERPAPRPPVELRPVFQAAGQEAVHPPAQTPPEPSAKSLHNQTDPATETPSEQKMTARQRRKHNLAVIEQLDRERASAVSGANLPSVDDMPAELVNLDVLHTPEESAPPATSSPEIVTLSLPDTPAEVPAAEGIPEPEAELPARTGSRDIGTIIIEGEHGHATEDMLGETVIHVRAPNEPRKKPYVFTPRTPLPNELAVLSPHERAILNHREVDGLQVGEIAETYGYDRAHVRSLLQTIYEKLNREQAG